MAPGPASESGSTKDGKSFEPASDEEIADLLDNFRRIDDYSIRRQMRDLMKTLAVDLLKDKRA